MKTPATKVARERRTFQRQALVLRIGVLSSDEETSFCLLKNISPAGTLVKVYGQARAGVDVTLRVGDEVGMPGRISWVQDNFAGIEFAEALPPEALLRVTQKLAPTKRRSSPRVSTAAKVTVRTAGKCGLATLSDISAMGARVKLARPITVGSTAMITLPGLPAVRAFVRWQDDAELGLAFETPLPIELIAQWLNERVRMTA